MKPSDISLCTHPLLQQFMIYVLFDNICRWNWTSSSLTHDFLMIIIFAPKTPTITSSQHGNNHHQEQCQPKITCGMSKVLWWDAWKERDTWFTWDRGDAPARRGGEKPATSATAVGRSIGHNEEHPTFGEMGFELNWMLNEMEFALNWMVKIRRSVSWCNFPGTTTPRCLESIHESDCDINCILISSSWKCGSGAIYVHLGVVGDQL